MDDVRAVMDAVGSERAVVFGVSEGGPMSMLFAATYPERDDRARAVRHGRGLHRAVARVQGRPGRVPRAHRTDVGHARLREGSRSRAGARRDTSPTSRLVAWLASYMRRSASPSAAVALELMNREINASHALPSIHVPTLMIAKEGDLDFRIEQIRDTASRIAGARLVELPGSEHFPWIGPADASSARSSASWSRSGRRSASSTGRWRPCCSPTSSAPPRRPPSSATDAGRTLVEEHHRLVRGQLARYRGVEVDTAGDGFFATFDGPARAVRCAQAIVDAVAPLGIEVRAGVHTGEVETIDGKVGGMAVVIGARVGASAGAVGGARLADREGPRRRQRPRVRGRRRARAEGRARPLAPVPRRVLRAVRGVSGLVVRRSRLNGSREGSVPKGLGIGRTPGP